ncbi:HAD-IIIA family hydrolase [Kribbella swartbergensis]
MTEVSVVIPTVGRDRLADLLGDLATQWTGPVYVVDDRPDPVGALPQGDYEVLRSGGRGPAAARNVGWRAAKTEWIAFLDDDVRLPADWSSALQKDLAEASDRVAGIQGGIKVPTGPRPTDWERSTAGLENAEWATADMAYRRTALDQVGGFDERFPRAYREDAELALRVRQHGWELVKGTRHVVHPVRDENFWVSVRVQRGNADDALMRTVHGRAWRTLAQCPPGRFKWHLATVLSAAVALLGSKKAAAVWALLTADFVGRRVTPGPRTPDEVMRMLATSAVIPFAAVWHRARGTWRHRGSTAWQPQVGAVLFDRDGTLIHDVPYNGDPEHVRAVPQARQAIRRLRAAGVPVGVITNQSGIGRGLITAEEVAAVNRRVDELLGPFDTWQVCPHTDLDGCVCRKPAAGLVLAAAHELGVAPSQVVVIGDIGSDIAAAQAAGAQAVLVPNEKTRADEIRAAPVVQPDLLNAVDQLLGDRP